MTKKTSPAYRASKEETIPINKLHPFSNHPFHIRHDLEFSELVDSISESGIITPIIVRPKVGVGYEVISGHRRWEACKELGIESIPARVEYIDDDEATILMVNSNIQREHVLPSEKAFAYKMRMEAMKHQGKATSSQLGTKLRTLDAMGKEVDESRNQIHRYIRLTYGNHYDLIYTLAGSSWYESVTGQKRHYTLQPLETPPENYEPKPAQVGVYLTAPVGFSQHVIVYLQNLYTDDVYDLELYESNGLAAVEPNALSGKYAFLSACVVGDAAKRYQFSCEQNELSTETGADFHLTVTDTASPDREMNTPSRDQNSTVQAANSFNNRNTDAPQQSTTQPEIVSQPVKQQKKQIDLLSLLLDFMPVVLVVAVLFAVCRKHRR